MVLRAKGENVLPEFLPFFLLSEYFWERANEISVGSLSTTINWKTIAKQEFLLPPKEQQAQLAELLWAADEMVEKKINNYNKLVECKHAIRKKIFGGYDKRAFLKVDLSQFNKNWKIKKVHEVCEICNNNRKPISKNERKKIQGIYPYYGPTKVLDFISEYRFDGEYVLIGEDGDHFLKYSDWSMTQLAKGKFNVNNHAHVLKGTSTCLTQWIHYSFQHRNIIPYLTRQGATRYKLNKAGILEIPILIPPLEEQKNYINQFNQIDDVLLLKKEAINTSKALQKSLINQIF